ncbi:MAG: DNA helicase II [Deltaproteobacteria bacterium ADurb.BinA179]|nr:MAG: DNA helicase II [Deltaproteobacteria bacterium ADurb.BinA179]
MRVITAHAAKGLEFKCVFIPDLSRDVFPLHGCPEDEESNLFYVAMTRAVDLLYLVSANGSPSPFISRIPPECCAVREEARKTRTQQLLLFEE